MTPPPLVSVVLATHDAATTLGEALSSVLAQTLGALELIVVDDGSTDATPELLASIAEPRLVVVRSDEQRGLAASLNAGLELARGRYVARLDADDVALPQRLARQVEVLARRPELGVLGTATLEIDADGVPGRLHRMRSGACAVAWHALFSSPFFHPTTMLDRELLERHGLRYDPAFAQAQDYELWTRLLRVAKGDNMDDALVLRRVHARQVSKQRRDGQRALQREIALRCIAEVAPTLSQDRAALAWLVGAGEPVPTLAAEAVDAHLELHARFAQAWAGDRGLAAVRTTVARAVMRAALGGAPAQRPTLLAQALKVDPALPLRGALGRARLGAARRRAVATATATRGARPAPAAREEPVRVVVVQPEPTPYRAPLLDRVAERPEVELTVLYAARTVAGRSWEVVPRHRAIVLEGRAVPGLGRALRHEYPVTPGVWRALDAADPEVVVVGGWSQFASQAAIAWCGRRDVPYVLQVSSHDAVERSAWRRAVRAPVVPRVVAGAWGALALGALSRASLEANGAAPERIGLFANTIDVPAWTARARELADRRDALREARGLAEDDVAVLSVARLASEKGLDVLVRAAAAAGDARLVLVVAGSGPARADLEALAAELGVRLLLLGDVPWDELPELYVACDVFALLSTWEPWGVVVNEAMACGLPLVLSDQVGAAPDLLRDGENGALVAAGDVASTADALARLAADPALRVAAGARSRELVAGWGYEPSVESFVDLVCRAAGRPRER